MCAMYAFYIVLLSATSAVHSHTIHSAVETEMFAIPISPNLFNWTYQEFDQQYRFHASLLGKPELPSWLRYLYSGRHHSGFIFGTPPRGSAGPISLEVIGLNRQDYETRRVFLTLDITTKEKMALHEVELKIDNLNVEDLLDEHKMTRLKDILRTKLWTESNEDLYATFLSSAIDLGARLPLKPSDGEGLVVRFGSSVPFSTELKRLREEVRPLSRLPSCPREYKRTTVERLFRDAGLTLDWCSFELYNTIYNERSTVHLEYLSELPDTRKSTKSLKSVVPGAAGAAGPAGATGGPWSAPARRALPARSYGRLLGAAVLAPLGLLLLSVSALTAVVCALHASVAHKSKVEMCRYGTGNTEQSQLPENVSNRSLDVSPNNSLIRPHSPKTGTNLAGNYNRPQPPPYMGSATNSLHHRRSADKTPSTSGHTPEHRTHLLEESLKLLNEAKISNEFEKLVLKDPIVDICDGTEDYVPIKPDQGGYIPMKPEQTGYVSMRSDSDDIGASDLSKFGLAGPI